MEQQEYIQRNLAITADDDRTISGSAILFDTPSEELYDGGTIAFTEIIHKGAITQDTINRSDIKLTYNHEKKAIPIARSNKGKGSLKVILGENSVDFRTPVKNTNSANEIYEAVRAGDLTGCSFVGTLLPKDHKLERQADGSYIHHIYNIQEIKDLSIVDVPAYSDTSVIARQLEEQKKTDEENLAKELQSQQQQVEELQRQKDLEYKNYISGMKKKYLI